VPRGPRVLAVQIYCRTGDGRDWKTCPARMAVELSFSSQSLQCCRKCSSAKFSRSHAAEDFPILSTIQGVGVDRLRRAVGTFRNVIVARWACKLLKMWWPETGSESLCSFRICNLHIPNSDESGESTRIPGCAFNLLSNSHCASYFRAVIIPGRRLTPCR